MEESKTGAEIEALINEVFAINLYSEIVVEQTDLRDILLDIAKRLQELEKVLKPAYIMKPNESL